MMEQINISMEASQIEDTTALSAQDEVNRLASLDPAAYETARKDAATKLAWRISFLDAEVAKAKQQNAVPSRDDDTSDPVEIIEPWYGPVDGAELAEEILKRLRAHVIFASPLDAVCAALWILGSYLMDTWRLWPRLLISSPTKACGKSTMLEVLDALVHRAILASNATPAVIFRVIEKWKPTLLLDEADTWVKSNEELAGILNSGHTRRTASVLRTVEVKGMRRPCPIGFFEASGLTDFGLAPF